MALDRPTKALCERAKNRRTSCLVLRIALTYRPKLEAQKPVISSIPVLKAEIHVTAIYQRYPIR
jgi:hypothetical protein